MSLKQNRVEKIRRFHALLAKTGKMAAKQDILAGYGVSSTKDLMAEDLDELIKVLQNAESQKPDTPRHIRRRRSIVLDLLSKIGIYNDNRDWEKVNNFLLQPRIAGKLLYHMNEDELKALCRKLHSILKKKIEKQEHEEFFAKNN